MKTAFSISFAVALLLLTGCGSIGARWQGDRGPYVGVQLATKNIAEHSSEGEIIAGVADMPLSAIVDTLLLPYDLATEPSVTEHVGTRTYNTGRIGYK